MNVYRLGVLFTGACVLGAYTDSALVGVGVWCVGMALIPWKD
jgi:hypothetical protein